jgi:hypothetical protein
MKRYATETQGWHVHYIMESNRNLVETIGK